MHAISAPPPFSDSWSVDASTTQIDGFDLCLSATVGGMSRWIVRFRWVDEWVGRCPSPVCFNNRSTEWCFGGWWWRWCTSISIIDVYDGAIAGERIQNADYRSCYSIVLLLTPGIVLDVQPSPSTHLHLRPATVCLWRAPLVRCPIDSRSSKHLTVTAHKR